MAAATTVGTCKYKRVVLSIRDKVNIIEMLDKFVCYTLITEKMG